MPTTNPVPSQDPSDLLFNAGKLDEVLNGTGNSFMDRLGVARRTVAGMNSDFDAQLADAESDLNVYRADAAASAAEALGYLQTIRATSYGAYASDPATDPLGNPPTVGDEYFNTTANLLKRWNGTTWQASDINTANLAAPSGSSLVGYLPTGTGAVATTVQSKLRESVSVKDFGAVGDGVADDTAAIQAAINYASANGKSVFIPDGTFLLDKLTFVDPTGLYAQRGQNVFGLLFAKSNVTIFGNGRHSVLKVAGGQLTKTFTYTADTNSGTYQNHAMPGTKGFQVFAQHPTDANINNFAIRDFTIDMNGYNNKVYPINAFGNQSQCHAVYINQGNDFVSERVRYVDHPGSQVICLNVGTASSMVKDNVFVNCGLLDGTNTNLDDHSTIYTMGANARVEGNRLTQDVQWTKKGGAAIEVHGTAIVAGNFVSKYLSMGVVSGINLSGEFVIERNIGRSITAAGYDLYQGANSFTLKARMAFNDVELTKVALAPTHPAYTHRGFIISPYTNSTSSAASIEVCYNVIKSIGAVTATTDLEETYNAAFNLRLLSGVTIRKNTIVGFRGPVITLLEQKNGSSIIFEGNAVVSCGRKHTYEVKNAAFNYTNRDDISYGNKLYALYSKQNTFESCAYAAYLSADCVAAGLLVVPTVIDVANDTTDIWMPPLVASADLGVSYTSYSWQFRYSCTGYIDATQALKVLPDSTKAYAKSCFGEISIKSGTSGEIPGTFTKMRAVNDWNYCAPKFGIAGPAAGEVSPFGAKQGDRLQVISGLVGQPSEFYCTTAGTPGAWVTVDQIGVRTWNTSPQNIFTAYYVGEEFLDTTNNRWYKAFQTTATAWVALN